MYVNNGEYNGANAEPVWGGECIQPTQHVKKKQAVWTLHTADFPERLPQNAFDVFGNCQEENETNTERRQMPNAARTTTGHLLHRIIFYDFLFLFFSLVTDNPSYI